MQRNRQTHLLFQGYLTGRYFEFSPDDETVTVVCQGPKWRLEADFVKGRYRLCKDGTYRVNTGAKCIFNENINRSVIAPQNGATAKLSTGVRLFSLQPEKYVNSTSYKINEMLWYCYWIARNWKAENFIGDPLNLTEFGIGTLGDLVVYDIGVDGLSVRNAFMEIFRKAALKWWCRPISENQSEIKAFLPGVEEIVKYLYLASVVPGVAPDVTPTLKTISNSENNIEAGRVQEDFSEVANEIYGYGGTWQYQDEFQLVPGWSNTTWQTLKAQGIEAVRKETRESTSSNWETYKDIGRLWILDETGDTTGEAWDFTELFGNQEWSAHVRPFAGERVDGERIAQVEASHPDLAGFPKVEMSVRLLEDQAGVYLEGDELASPLLVEQTATAMEGGATVAHPSLADELYITAVVFGDKAVEKNLLVSNPAGNDIILVGLLPDANGEHAEINRRQAILVDREYTADNINTMRAEEVQEKLLDLVTRKIEDTRKPQVSASFSLPWISVSYEPGDTVKGILGREVFFTAQIVEVRFELGLSQRTELLLEDLRLAES